MARNCPKAEKNNEEAAPAENSAGAEFLLRRRL